jgi:hypothetical protein
LDIEKPVACRYSPVFHFHPTWAGMDGLTLIRHQVIGMRQPPEKRRLAPLGVMEAFDPEQFPLDGIMGLIQQAAGHRHLRICEHRTPARVLLLHPAPHALAVGRPSRGGDVIGKVAKPLTQGKLAHALALARPVQRRVELRAQGHASRRGDGDELSRNLIARVAQAVAETRPREERPHTLGRAVEAIREDPSDPIRGLPL